MEVKEAEREARHRKYRQAMAYREEATDHSAAGRYAEAIITYKKWIAIEPDEEDAYSYLAEAYSKLGQQENAISTWEKCIAVEMKSPSYSDMSIGGSYSCIGDAYVELQKYTDAIAAYKKAIDHLPDDPDYVWSYWEMAQTYEKLAKYPEAIAIYRKLSRFKPISLASKAVVEDARKRISELSKRESYDKLNKQLTELEKSQGGGLKMKAATQPADK